MNFKNLWLLCSVFLFGSSVVQAQNVEAIRRSLEAYNGHVEGTGRTFTNNRWVRDPKVLRRAQQPMFDAIVEYVTQQQGSGRGLEGYIIAPTGTGKTVIYSKVVEGMVQSTTSKILIVVPSLNLISQTYDELLTFTDIPERDIGLVHSGKKEFGRRVTITTYASWVNGTGFRPRDYDAVILDEAHRGLSELRQATLQQYRHAIKIGLTATAEFSDTKQVAMILGDLIYEISIKDAIETLGLLSSYRTILHVFEGIDLANVPVTGEDYDEAKLGEWLTKNEVERAAIAAYRAYEGITTNTTGARDQAVVYCSGIAHSEIVARAFNEAGIPAIAIHSGMKKEERETILRQFKEGNSPYRVLTNPNVLIEGFDAPELRMIINLRPTLSKIVALQRFGRLLRLSRLDPNKVGLAVEFIYSNSKRDKEGKVKQLLIPTAAGAGVRWNANKTEAERRRIERALTEKAAELQRTLNARTVRIYTSQVDIENVSRQYSKANRQSDLEILEALRERIIKYNQDHPDTPITSYNLQYSQLGKDVPSRTVVRRMLEVAEKDWNWLLGGEVKLAYTLESLRAKIIQYNKDHPDALIMNYYVQYSWLGNDVPAGNKVKKMLGAAGKDWDWLFGREVKSDLEILGNIRSIIIQYNKDNTQSPITSYQKQYRQLGEDVPSHSTVKNMLDVAGLDWNWLLGGEVKQVYTLESLRDKITQYNGDNPDVSITNYKKLYLQLGEDVPSYSTVKKMLDAAGLDWNWLLGGEVKQVYTLESLRDKIIQYNMENTKAPITSYSTQYRQLGADVPAGNKVKQMLEDAGLSWDWLYGKTGGGGSGYLGSGPASFFARGGGFEQMVNAVVKRVGSMLPGDAYVSMKGIPSEDMAQLQRLPKVLRDRIYRFYGELYTDMVSVMGEEALPYERMYDMSVSLATMSLGEGMAEDYREGLRQIETRYVEAFKEQLNLSSRPDAIALQQVHFLACLFAMQVGQLVNRGLSVEQAMVKAYQSVTSPDGLIGLGSFVVTSVISTEIGRFGIWKLIQNKALSVDGAKKLLGVLSFGSLGLGMAAQESYGAFRQIQEMNRVGSLADNVAYLQKDQEGLGNTGLIEFFQNPVNVDVGLLDQVYGEVGLRISTDRSPLAMMGELEYKLYTRAEYKTERMRPSAGNHIKQKLGLQIGNVDKNLRYALGHVNVVDTLVHTGILMASSLVGSQVPYLGTIVTLSLAGEFSRVYDQMRYRIDTPGRLSDYEQKIRKLVWKDESLATRMSQVKGERLTPELVKEKLEPLVETMRLQHLSWREEVEKQATAVMGAYAEVYRRTVEYIRAMTVKRGLGYNPEHTEMEIAEDTVLALEIYGERPIKMGVLEAPSHRVADIDQALKTLHYSHLALENLMNVNWINSLKGAGCRSTIGCLEQILKEDEQLYKKRSKQEIEEAKLARVPLRLVVMDELMNVASVYKHVEQLNKQREYQAEIRKGRIDLESGSYSKTAFDIKEAALNIKVEKQAMKSSAPIAAKSRDVLELVGLKSGEYEVSIVASVGGSKNTGQKPKTYRKKLETIDVEQGERYEIKIPRDTLDYCKQAACYLHVVNKRTGQSVPSMRSRI